MVASFLNLFNSRSSIGRPLIDHWSTNRPLYSLFDQWSTIVKSYNGRLMLSIDRPTPSIDRPLDCPMVDQWTISQSTLAPNCLSVFCLVFCLFARKLYFYGVYCVIVYLSLSLCLCVFPHWCICIFINCISAYLFIYFVFAHLSLCYKLIY